MNEPRVTVVRLSVGGLIALAVLWVACGGGSPGFTQPPPPPPPPADKPASIQVVSGAGQSTAVATQLPSPLVVQVLDSVSQPLSNVALTWSLHSGGGSVSPVRFTTDASGQASANFTVGSNAGVDSVKANVTGTSLNTYFAALAVSPPPPDTTWPNQPAGFTIVTNRAFNADGENGWSSNTDPGSHFSIVSDPLAPRSPPNVGQADFPVGWNIGGYDPIDTHIAIASYNFSQLYMSFWVKLSSNWIPHPSGTNKIAFVWVNQSPNIYFAFQHSTTPMSAYIKLQGGPQAQDGTLNLNPNINDVPLLPGVWYRWEILLQFNTGANFDGVAHWWINGTEAGNWTNIRFDSTTHIFGAGDGVNWKPVYGGGGTGTLAIDMHMWMDQWYISGKQ